MVSIVPLNLNDFKTHDILEQNNRLRDYVFVEHHPDTWEPHILYVVNEIDKLHGDIPVKDDLGLERPNVKVYYTNLNIDDLMAHLRSVKKFDPRFMHEEDDHNSSIWSINTPDPTPEEQWKAAPKLAPRKPGKPPEEKEQK